MRKEFKLTEDDLKEFFAEINKCDPLLYISGGIPLFRTPQQKANSKWKEFGKKYGFKWETVRPIPGKGQEWFSAEIEG